MGDYIISCCSTADLTEEHFRSRDIHYMENSIRMTLESQCRFRSFMRQWQMEQ